MLREQKGNKHDMLWLKVEEGMEDKNWNQNQLAKKAGVNNTVISALKLGKIKKPSFELICKIADALEISLDEFREEKNNEISIK